MVSGTPPPDSGTPKPSGARRPRPPTVIDLEATEVASDSAGSAGAGAPPPSSANPDNPAPPDGESAATEPPPPKEAAKEEKPSAAPEVPIRTGSGVGWSAMAGLAGGFLAFALLWIGGVLLGTPQTSQAPADFDARLAALEKQVADRVARPAEPGVDTKALASVAARVAKLESTPAAPRTPAADPAMLNRLGASESAAKSLSENLAAQSARADRAEAGLRDAQARLERLGAAVTALEARAKETAAGSDRASRLAIAANTLRDAVARGAPFAAELAVVKPLAPGAAAMSALEPFASSGLPTDAALGQELAGILRPMLRAAPEAKHDGGFLDRLQANAEKLVRIRPIDETGGDERNAVLARIVQRAERANIAGARAELTKLPVADRAAADKWVAKVEARDAALEASRRLAADAVAALKATP
jgi:hypothetical protein